MLLIKCTKFSANNPRLSAEGTRESGQCDLPALKPPSTFANTDPKTPGPKNAIIVLIRIKF
jgi:hypothetical protein